MVKPSLLMKCDNSDFWQIQNVILVSTDKLTLRKTLGPPVAAGTKPDGAPFVEIEDVVSACARSG
jgi:hypothetical protein